MIIILHYDINKCIIYILYIYQPKRGILIPTGMYIGNEYYV